MENPYNRRYDYLLEMAKEYDFTLSQGSYEIFVIKDSGTVFYYDADSDNNVNQNEVKADILEISADGEFTCKVMNIIEFAESKRGLDIKLLPQQKFFLKIFKTRK